MKKIYCKNRLVARLFDFLGLQELEQKPKNKKELIDFLIENIKEASEKDFHFKDPRNLKEILTVRLYDENFENLEDILGTDYPLEKILSQTKETAKSLYKVLPSKNCVNVYLFPAADSFARTKMNGVNGYTPESGTIFLFLDCKISQDSSFFQEISGVTAHEYNHSVRFSYFPAGKFYSLGDVIVNEGLAENFRMRALDLPVAPWAKALDYEKSRKIFAVLQDKLDSKDDKLYKDLFFGSDDYPLWAGYAVGFYLISDFLQNRNDEDWSEIMKTDSETIIKKSGWC